MREPFYLVFSLGIPEETCHWCLVTVIVEEDQTNTLVSSPGAFIRRQGKKILCRSNIKSFLKKSGAITVIATGRGGRVV